MAGRAEGGISALIARVPESLLKKLSTNPNHGALPVTPPYNFPEDPFHTN